MPLTKLLNASDDTSECLPHQVRARADQLLSDFPGLHAEARVLGVGFDGLRPTDAVSSRPRLSLALPRTAAVRPPAHDSASWTNQIRQAERFVGQLRFGKPIEAAQRVHRLVGLEAEALAMHAAAGERAIFAEFAAFAACGAPSRDALGWTDLDWLDYVSHQSATERPLPAGMPCAVLDLGHQGLTLDDFHSAPAAQAANLSRADVLALRLYSGESC